MGTVIRVSVSDKEDVNSETGDGEEVLEENDGDDGIFAFTEGLAGG